MNKRLAVVAGLLAASPVHGQAGRGYVYVLQDSRAVVDCHSQPISLDGSHTSTRMIGYCPALRVTGEHNDIFLPVPPGALIAVVAPHNDITWHQTAPGPPPRLVQLAPSNSFHRG